MRAVLLSFGLLTFALFWFMLCKGVCKIAGLVRMLQLIPESNDFFCLGETQNCISKLTSFNEIDSENICFDCQIHPVP